MKIKFIANKSSELYISPFNEKQFTKLIYSLDISFNTRFFENLKISELVKDEVVDMFMLATLIKYNNAISMINSYIQILLLEKEISNKYIIFPQEKIYECCISLYHSKKTDMRDVINWINSFEFTEDDLTTIEWEKGNNWWREEDLKIIKEALSLVNMSELF